MDLSIPVLPVRWCRLLPNVDGPGRCRAADAGRDLRPAVTHCITGSTRIVPPGRRPRLLTRFLAVVRPWPGAAVLGLVTLSACWHELSRRVCIRPLTSHLESFLELQAGTATGSCGGGRARPAHRSRRGLCCGEGPAPRLHPSTEAALVLAARLAVGSVRLAEALVQDFNFMLFLYFVLLTGYDATGRACAMTAISQGRSAPP